MTVEDKTGEEYWYQGLIDGWDLIKQREEDLRALRKDHREMVNEMAMDPSMRVVFNGVIKACQELEQKLKIKRYDLAKVKAECVTLVGITWAELHIVDLTKRLEKAERTRRRMERYKMVLSLTKKGVPIDRQPLQVDDAKEVPINELVDARFEVAGTDRKRCKCPFHNEKTASFMWYVRQNSWWCYGCSEGGDAIALYMKLYKCDFVTAVKSLTRVA